MLRMISVRVQAERKRESTGNSQQRQQQQPAAAAAAAASSSSSSTSSTAAAEAIYFQHYTRTALPGSINSQYLYSSTILLLVYTGAHTQRAHTRYWSYRLPLPIWYSSSNNGLFLSCYRCSWSTKVHHTCRFTTYQVPGAYSGVLLWQSRARIAAWPRTFCMHTTRNNQKQPRTVTKKKSQIVGFPRKAEKIRKGNWKLETRDRKK